MQVTNIILQFATLALIFISWRLKKRGKYVWHGNLMLAAVFIIGLMAVAHMGPSLIGVEGDIVTFSSITPIFGVIHASVGIVALVLGGWLVANWAYIQSSPNQYCAARRRMMRRILIVWLAALALGMTYYFFHSILPA